MDKDLKELTDKFNEKLETLSTDLENQKGTTEAHDKSVKELRDLLSEYKTNRDADVEKATKSQEHIDAIELKVNEFDMKTNESKPIGEQIEKLFDEDGYKGAKEQKGHAAAINIKADDITTSNSFTQTNTPIIPYDRDPRIGVDPRNPFILTQLVGKGVTTSDYIDWFEQTGETDGTGAVAEAGAFGQSDLSWTSYKIPVNKIGGYATISREKLEDTDFVKTKIIEALGYQAPNNLEYQMWSGDGTSNQQYGFLGAAAYNAAKTFSLASGVTALGDNANEYDVLAAVILQIELGSNTTNSQTSLKAGFMPNAVIVNPVTWYNMTRLKDTTGQYLVGMDGIMRVNGVPIYKSTRIAAGSYLVGDFTRAKLWMRRNTEIRMYDQHSTNAIYDLVTFTVSNRAALVVQNVDTYAFVTGTFSAGLSALSSGS